MSAANFQQQQASNKNQPPSSVIQTPQLPKTSMASMMPSLYQAHDAFQTLVNAAASQQSLAIPPEKSKDDLKIRADDKSGFFNHSALKFSRNPFTKEQFEKEIKSQELIKKQQQKLADESAAKGRKTPHDLEASKIFSDSFQKDPPHSSNMMSTSGLIDAIIAHQINLPDKGDKPSASAGSFNASGIPSNYLNDHIKSIIDNCNPLAANQSINSLYLLQNVSTNPSLVSSASSSPSLATKASDDLMNENWKLRKALEQKEAAQRKESAKIESQIELEPISPPSTPTKEQQSLTSSLNLSVSLKAMPWPSDMTSQLTSSLSVLAQNQALSNQSALLGQSSLSNLQLDTSVNKTAPDPVGFQKYFQNRIAQAMSTSEQDKEPDIKKLKLDVELKVDESKKDPAKGENKVAYSTPPPLLTEKLPVSGLENISSLSELKAQRAEFQKQQQKLKLKEGEKAD